MYDSRSDHPRKGLHLERWYSDMRTGGTTGVDGGEWQESNLRRKNGDAKTQIAEGLDEYLDEPDTETAIYQSSGRTERPAKATKEATMYDPNRNIAVAERSPGVIYKPRTAKHQPRVKGEPFDASKVSSTLSPRVAANIQAVHPAKTATN